MVRTIALAAVAAMLLGGCGSGAPAPTDEPGWALCEADVSNAAYSHAQPGMRTVQDLDPAIHDCKSLDQLTRAVAVHPGAIPAGVELRVFVTNRCEDGASFAYPSPSCTELGARP